MIRLSKKHNNLVGLTLCAGLFLIFTMESAMAGITPDVRYSKGLLTLKADKTPLLDILKAISEAAAIDVLISKDFIPADLSIQFKDQPLESALKRVLAAYNHVVFYQKKDSRFKISEIRVYPKGTGSEPLRALIDKAPTVEDRPVAATEKGTDDSKPLPISDMPSRPDRPAGQAGLLAPIPYTNNQKSKLAGTFGKRFEIEEQSAFAEIEELKKRIDLTENAEERDALQLVFMDELAAFENLQRRNQNRLEAMHRIELFENSKENKEQTK